jgi:hypothetical protein
MAVEERLQDDHYEGVRSCKHYPQGPGVKDLNKKEDKKDCRERGGPCGGVTIWNGPGIIAKYLTEKAKVPYNLSPISGSAGKKENSLILLGGGSQRI